MKGLTVWMRRKLKAFFFFSFRFSLQDEVVGIVNGKTYARFENRNVDLKGVHKRHEGYFGKSIITISQIFDFELFKS